jgi:hypothetical protein
VRDIKRQRAAGTPGTAAYLFRFGTPRGRRSPLWSLEARLQSLPPGAPPLDATFASTLALAAMPGASGATALLLVGAYGEDGETYGEAGTLREDHALPIRTSLTLCDPLLRYGEAGAAYSFELGNALSAHPGLWGGQRRLTAADASPGDRSHGR